MICRQCNSTDLKLYYTQGHEREYKLYKCQNCSLVNLDLSNVTIDENQEKYENELPNPTNPDKNLGAKLTYEFIRKHIPQKGKILDIGCGNGSLLYMAKQDDWDVHGLEISQKLANEVEEKLNIPVQVNNFMEMENIAPENDVVILRHVLEHIPDGILAMTNINKLLKEDGHAVLEFPNIEGFSFKIRRFLEKTGISKKRFKKGYVPGHCNEYSEESFEYLCNKTGFELLEWQTYSYTPLKNFIYGIFNSSTKARVLIRKK